MTRNPPSSPLEYPANSGISVRVFRKDRAPLATDFRNFKVRDFWNDTVGDTLYYLTDKTSSSGTWILLGLAGGNLNTLTGNAGGAVSPNVSNNIDIVGSAPISVTGNPGTNTLTIDSTGVLAITYTTDAGGAMPAADNINILGTAAQGISTSGAGSTVTLTNADSTATQKGVVELATNAEAIAGTDTSRAITADDLKAKLGAQTANSVPIGASDSVAIAWTAALTDGQILIGSTGVTPVLGTLTAGTGIVITNAAGSITIDSSGTHASTYTADAGSATPAANNLNVIGTAAQGISTSGAGDTLTLTASDATAAQKGVLETATDAEAIAVTAADKAIVPSNLAPLFASPPAIGGTAASTGEFTQVTSPLLGPGAGNDLTVTLGDAVGGNNLIVQNTTPATLMNIDSLGHVTKPLQPAFLANHSVLQSNVTGDGTSYTVLFDTAVFDQNGDYNTGTSTFTAPVTGKYAFYSSVSVVDIGAAHTTEDYAVRTSNRDYGLAIFNPAAARDATNRIVKDNALFADMDAADTAITLYQVFNGTKTIDILGNTTVANATSFAGHLVA